MVVPGVRPQGVVLATRGARGRCRAAKPPYLGMKTAAYPGSRRPSLWRCGEGTPSFGPEADGVVE
jgi:hypothetical protein